MDYVRATLHGQNEDASGGLVLTLANESGERPARPQVHVNVAPVDMCETEIVAALGRLRPLAFGAAFKIQDMIAEWVLHANGVNERPFSRKVEALDKLRKAGSLVQPPPFDDDRPLSEAFWELYRSFVQIRNAVAHSGRVTLAIDGTLEVAGRSGTTRLRPPDQAAYMRSVCVIAKVFTGRAVPNAYLTHLVRADFRQLLAFHGVQLDTGQAFVKHLTVRVPPSRIESRNPLTLEIDFDELRQTMGQAFRATPDRRVYFSVAVVVPAGERELTWHLPIETVPTGVVKLIEGDATWDRFLQVGSARDAGACGS